MKTFKELEEIGIIGKYIYNNKLRVIVKNGDIWGFNPYTQKFNLLETL